MEIWQPSPEKKRKRKAALRPKEAASPEKEEIWSTSEDSQEEYVPKNYELYSEDSEDSENEKLHSQQKRGQHKKKAKRQRELRKHVATMSKVLNLKDNEMDELASFLGHDIRVHREYYRLPEGTLQLAKISKVLMALERGSISKYKGKNLDEIQIDPQEKVLEDTESEGESSLQSSEEPCSSKSSERSWTSRATTSTSLDEDSQTSTFQEPSSRPSTSSDLSFPEDSEDSKRPNERKKVQKRPWTTKEIQAVEKTLLDFIQTGKVPGKEQCTHCIESSAQDLEGRTWQGVKFYVKNRIEALRRASFIRK